MSKSTSISIIGPGRVGSVLALKAHQAGINVIAIGGRNEEKAKSLAKQLSSSTIATSCEEAASLGDLVFLTVCDDIIPQLCEKLSLAKHFKTGATIVHCSGALSSNELRAAQEICSCSIASFHPLFAFSSIETTLKNIDGAYAFIEGEEKAVKELLEFGKKISLNTEIISTENKITHHAAAVFALNFLTTIFDAALTVEKVAGNNTKSIASAFLYATRSLLNNIESLGTAQALTGPIARGDFNLVSKQLKDLSSKDPSLGRLYAVLSEHTAHLANKAGRISSEKLSDFIALLNQKL